MAALIPKIAPCQTSEIADMQSQVSDLERVIVSLVITNGELYIDDGAAAASIACRVVICRDEANRRHVVSIEERDEPG